MTNGEKYKIAHDRAVAFRYYCDNIRAATNRECVSKGYCLTCQFGWLELEANELNPLPCPFCNGSVVLTCENGMFHYACTCGYSSQKRIASIDSIYAHNRVAKRCMEVKE